MMHCMEQADRQRFQNVLKQVVDSGKVDGCDNQGVVKPLKLAGLD